MQQSNAPPMHHELALFLTLPGEELLFAKRKHWLILVLPLLLQGWIGLMLFGITYLFLVSFFSQALLFLVFTSTIVVVMLSIMAKTIVDWYFHFYIITTRKMIEYCCTPLFSHSVNEILLDQVRCTEIDVRTEGIVNHLVNKGDVTVTFDRPTHQEEMILTDISDPRSIGIFLADTFDMLKTDSTSEGVWFRSRGHNRHYYFTDGLSHKGGFL